jgi:secreted PhoX family phosphatase
MFTHEAAAVDPKTSTIYQTEDTEKSGFYRFVPEKKINAMDELAKAKGKFQVMEIKSGGKVKWNDVNDPKASGWGDLMKRKPNKKIKYKKFKNGEGAWYHDGKVYFATTETHQIWTYDIANETCKVLYRGKGRLKYPDNVTVSNTGLVMAAEDGDNMEICGISNKKNKAFRIVKIVGHKKSEITGPAFDPSGTRLYFSSQRGKNGFTGITYEVTGPFHKLV